MNKSNAKLFLENFDYYSPIKKKFICQKFNKLMYRYLELRQKIIIKKIMIIKMGFYICIILLLFWTCDFFT